MTEKVKMIKRLIIPVLFSATAIHLPVQANTIRIIGPSSEDQPAAQTTVSQPVSSQAARSVHRYGPTTNQETLWSIASRYRPNDQVSIYQVIGAFYSQNPQAFENGNLHRLIPGSILAVPTHQQMRQENTDRVKQRLETDKRTAQRTATPSPAQTPSVQTTSVQTRSAQTPQAQTTMAQPKPQPKPTPKPAQQSNPAPKVVATPIAPQPAVTEATTPQSSSAVDTQEAQQTAAQALIPSKPTALQAQLQASDEQVAKLMESNHLLRVRLAEMQHEVAAMKEQITQDEALRSEIKGFIEQQRHQVQNVQPATPEPNWFDRMIDNPWALAAMGLIPGGLIAALLAYFLLGRRKEEEQDDGSSNNIPDASDPVMAPPLAAIEDEKPVADPEEEHDPINDLFGDDSLFDDPEDSLFAAEDKAAKSVEDSFNNDNDLDFESSLAASSISVKGDDEAIGLQDMERALDELDQKADSSSDEALAAMWEQSLRSDDDDEDSFDLSLDTDDNSDELLNQSMLDDLLEDADSVAEQNSATLRADKDDVINQDDLDALFAGFSSDADLADASLANIDTESKDAKEDAIFTLAEEEKQQSAIDQALADAELLTATAQDDIDDLLDANSVSLLDELVEDEDDGLSADIELEEDSTALLDELIDNEDPLDVPDIELDENSTALLDELIDGPVPELDIDDEEAWLDQELAALADSQSDDWAHENSAAELNATESELLFEPELEPEAKKSDGFAPESDTAEPVAIESVAVEPEADDIKEETQAVTGADEDGVDQGIADDEAVYAESVDAKDAVRQKDADVQDVDSEGLAHKGLDIQGLDLDGLAAQETATNDVDSNALPDEQLSSSLPQSDLSQSHMSQPHTVETKAFEQDLADIEALLDSSVASETAGADVETLGQTVDQLLESLDEQEAMDIAERVADEPVLTGDDYDAFPIFDEETALADAEQQALASDEPGRKSEATAAFGTTEPLNLDDLPEFDEEAAWNDPEAETELLATPDISDEEEQAVLDNIVRQLQQAAEAVEPAAHQQPQPEIAKEVTADVTEEATAAIVGSEAAEKLSERLEESYSIHGRQDIEFETLDPASLPEFGEDDALQASFDEQHELEQFELESGLRDITQTATELSHDTVMRDPGAEEAMAVSGKAQTASAMPPLDEELVDTAGLDMDALLFDPLAEAHNVAQPAAMMSEKADASSAQEHQPAPDSGMRAESQPDVSLADVAQPDTHITLPEASEAELEREQLFADFAADTTVDNVEPDWNEEDQAIWTASNPDPELESEDWGVQPPMDDQDVAAFDETTLLDDDEASLLISESEALAASWGESEADSELVSEPSDSAGQEPESQSAANGVNTVSENDAASFNRQGYISIDELMKDLDIAESEADLDDAPLNLEVGLDEFPDVLANVGDYDVDSGGEYASKLDLAKAYLEMNDQEGAMGLLEEIAVRADSALQQEAKALLARISA